MESIHQTAVVDPAADLGSDVRIGPYSVVERDVTIGDGCVVGPRVSILSHTVLGAGCRVHANAVLGDLPQDTAFDGAPSYLKIGDDVVLREGVTLHRGTKPESSTVIGDRCMLMGHSHYAHNVQLGDDVNVVNGALLGGYVSVGDRAFISGNCTIHQFVRIGRLAMIAGGCGVTKDVPPFMTLQPVTLNVIGGLNVIGMRRAGVSGDQRRAVKEAFRVLYRSGLGTAQAIARMREASSDELVAEICDFVEASERGICAWRGNGSDGE